MRLDCNFRYNMPSLDLVQTRAKFFLDTTEQKETVN